MRLNRVAIGGVAGILGLGLIGVGAHAAFTSQTTSNQSVSTGTMDVVLHATTGKVASGNTTATLTLNASNNNGSTFSTGTIQLLVKNIGTVAITQIKFTPGDTHTTSPANTALADGVAMCVVSYTGPAHAVGNVLFNGLLSTLGSETTTGPVSPGSYTTYVVNVFAGKHVHTACGNVPTGTNRAAPSTGGTDTVASTLGNSAQGATINPSVTVTEVA